MMVDDCQRVYGEGLYTAKDVRRFAEVYGPAKNSGPRCLQEAFTVPGGRPEKDASLSLYLG